MIAGDLGARLQAALGATYHLERELGGGSMSRVFVAEERALGRRVVIKVLPPEAVADVSAERFRLEIQLVARLQHPNIVPLFAAGDAGGLLYYVMPYIAGESLRARLAAGPLPLSEAVRVLRDVARALAHAHRQGVVHRDVKPENVLLADDAALVADFGVARALAAASGTATGPQAGGLRITKAGFALGTPAYMAPEQAAADPAADHRVDLYALGCLAYELLAGTPPFGAVAPSRQIVAHATEEPRRVADVRPDAPPALARLVHRCLAKSPEDRPATAAEVLAELEAVATPGDAGPSTGPVAAPPAARPPRGLVAIALGVVVLVAAVVVATLLRG